MQFIRKGKDRRFEGSMLHYARAAMVLEVKKSNDGPMGYYLLNREEAARFKAMLEEEGENAT